MNWKVLYDDGSSFTDEDGSPNDAPAWGVVAAISTEDDIKALTEGDDYYYFNPLDDRWYGVDLVGLIDFLTHTGFLKIGRFVPIKQYQKILEQALADVSG
jgi:hypothetical protein